jgi:predicted P-loop ATPase
MKDKDKNLLYQTDIASNTIFDRIIKYINSKYRIRFNIISLDYEINLISSNYWEPLNLYSLIIELTRNNIETNYHKLEIIIKSNLIEKYDPIQEYFLELQKWNKEVDYIKKLASYVNTDNNDAFEYHLRKWFVRAVKCVFEDDKINKHCLVLANGDQHAGKSTYLNSFIPKKLQQYMSVNIGTDKDSRIKMCKNFLINLEELAVIGKAEVNYIKSLISMFFINERLPYDRKAQKLPRICSFIGSTNMVDFLTDETGSVRWIIFDVIGKINFKYSNEMNMDEVWSQAYYLAYQDKNFESELTHQDVIDNENRNEKYTNYTVEQEMVLKYYEKTEGINYFGTATDLALKLLPLGHKLNREKMGKALNGFKFKRIKHPQKQVYGYLAKPKFKTSPVEIMNN